ncbi:polysaccharide deacetylase family protein [uncultured Desulfobulbus sp.]|uniref:polysaccharide deacetylase family protein n=1 Tax=uncultured Desulfobulbus sp. TaxID=239745 RepID=UPI0029C818A8|nr:polysaccharide deacetylase family protein [uncultured Desulfobulbus sp.]
MFFNYRLKNFIKFFLLKWLIIYKNDKSSGVVLTFDDGPDEIITPLILKILEENNAQAIFFVLGRKAERYPELVKLIVKNGHIVGNHTHTHISAYSTNYCQYLNEIQSCQQTIYNITGEYPRYFRPPNGSLSLSALLAIKRSNLKNVLWSVESGEYGVWAKDTPEMIHNRLFSVLSNQDVLLMHDNSEKVPLVLETLVPALSTKGVIFAKAGEL